MSSASSTSPSWATSERSPELISNVVRALSKTSSSLGAAEALEEASLGRVFDGETLHDTIPKQHPTEAAIQSALNLPAGFIPEAVLDPLPAPAGCTD